MGVTFTINGKRTDDINAMFRDIDAAAGRIKSRILMAVRLACLATVRRARELPSPPETMRGKPHQPNYIDQTGILRASIGFAIYDQGQRVMENFETGGEGAAQGIKTAEDIAKRFPDKIVAIVVAGADYAAAVESRGYFVLSEPASHLGEIMQTYLSQIRLTNPTTTTPTTTP